MRKRTRNHSIIGRPEHPVQDLHAISAASLVHERPMSAGERWLPNGNNAPTAGCKAALLSTSNRVRNTSTVMLPDAKVHLCLGPYKACLVSTSQPFPLSESPDLRRKPAHLPYHVILATVSQKENKKFSIHPGRRPP